MEERLKSIFAAFQGEKNELISLLQEVQEEFGYLPVEAMQEVARFLRLPESKVFGVATFYARFHLEPRGRHILRQCCGTACHVRGAQRIADKIMDVLKVEAGRTTRICGLHTSRWPVSVLRLAPVMTIDETTTAS